MEQQGFETATFFSSRTNVLIVQVHKCTITIYVSFAAVGNSKSWRLRFFMHGMRYQIHVESSQKFVKTLKLNFLIQAAALIKQDQVHLACRTQFGDLQFIFLWMKRRTEKEWVFRPNRLWVYCPMILEFLGVWSLEEKMNREKKRMIFRERSIKMIICKRSFYPVDHLQ